jgi:hypothetical protein
MIEKEAYLKCLEILGTKGTTNNDPPTEQHEQGPMANMEEGISFENSFVLEAEEAL